MKKIFYHTTICLLALGFLSSCEDLLDKKPLTEIGEASVWSDPALVNAFVNSRYNQIGHGWTESMQSSTVDETILTWSRGCEPYTQGYLSPTDLGRNNGGWWGWDNRGWGTVWGNISDCNLFLQNVENATFANESQKNSLVGQVRFIRALMYHDLVSRWGGVPLITKSYTLNDVEEAMNAERASYKECVDFMVNELDEAAGLLPATWSGKDKGRATSVAALALKARVLLYAASDLMNVGVKDQYIGYTTPENNRWQKVIDAAEACITLAKASGYGLYDEYDNDVKTKYTHLFMDGGNKEVLFDREGTSNVLGQQLNTIDQYNGPNGYGGWGGNTPLQELVDAYEMADGTLFDWSDPGKAANPYANRDPRLYATILCDNDQWHGRAVETWFNADASGVEQASGGRDSKFGQDAWNTSLTGYYMRKFMDEEYAYNSWVCTPRNFIWLRLAEQYLILAEAYHMNGNDGKALENLNVIRDRARMPHVTVGGDELMERIRNERRVELAFEEHRYFDVRRWKLGNQYLNKTVHGIKILKKPDGTKIYQPGTVVEERKFVERMYWMPIPKSEIDKNPKLVQNWGYTN